MKVVTNTSPLINLSVIGHTELLELLFQQVEAPEIVHREMVSLQARDGRFSHVIPPNFVCFHQLQYPEQAKLLALHLDPGEAGAIALALELKADLLLLDERKATLTARRLGLRTLGLVGVLLLAKQRGFLAQVAPLLGRLELEAGFWLSGTLKQQVLTTAGEA